MVPVGYADTLVEILGDGSILRPRCSVKSVAKGTIITMVGQRSGNGYALLEGSARLSLVNAQGRRQVLAELGPGRLFNLSAVFGDDSSDVATATMVTSGRLLIIPGDALRQQVAVGGEASAALMRSMANEVNQLRDLARDLALTTVRERLARFVLELKQSQAPRRWTHQQIAEKIGSVREVVSRGLRDLARDGVIELRRHQVIVVDERALRQEAGLWELHGEQHDNRASFG